MPDKMDTRQIRDDFPILGDGRVYFDNAATTLTPRQVLDAMNEYYEEFNANVHRGLHKFSIIASEKYEESRKNVANFINADSDEIAFFSNTSKAINFIALSLDWKKGDKIVTTEIEHHSNLLPWLRLKRKFGINVEIVKADENGCLNIEDFENAINEKTRLVALTHISNVTGAVSQVRDVGKISGDNNALCLVDGAQSVPHIKIDIKKLNCDFMAFSAHKMLGPTGIGAVYIKKDVSDELDPACVGGGNVKDVSLDDYTLLEPPQRFETGTPPIAEAIGFSRAVRYLEDIGIERIEKHEKELSEYAINLLGDIDGLKIYGTDKPGIRRIGIIPFNIRGIDAGDLASILDSHEIAVRSGHHCAIPLMRVFGIKETIRASFYLYNTKEEIEKMISVFGKI